MKMTKAELDALPDADLVEALRRLLASDQPYAYKAKGSFNLETLDRLVKEVADEA